MQEKFVTNVCSSNDTHNAPLYSSDFFVIFKVTLFLSNSELGHVIFHTKLKVGSSKNPDFPYFKNWNPYHFYAS